MKATTNTKEKVGTLYARFGPTIYARCRRILKNPAAAEDATQEVFVKVMNHIATAPSEESVLPWIHRIATNHCLNMIRDGRRQPEPVAVLPVLRDDDFEAGLVSDDFAARVLAETPPEEKLPAVLYHLKGMEQSKVAATLGISRRTVLYRLSAFASRARRLYQLAELGQV